DANVMLGKLMPEFFPKIFGPAQDEALDAEAVRAAFAAMAAEVGDGRSPEEVADGFIQIAVANMAEAIKKISVQRGYDITAYALNSFGGAGGQHACLVADALGMTKVLMHPFSGLLSAYGMGLADVRATRQKALDVPLDAAAPAAVAALGDALAAECLAELEGQGIARSDIETFVRAHVRYAGTDTALAVPAGDVAAMQAAFEDAHRRRFGFIDDSKGLVVEAVEVETVGGGARFAEEAAGDVQSAPAEPHRMTRFFSQGRWHEAGVFLRQEMKAGARVPGPAVVIEPNQTVVVEDGWEAQLTGKDHLVLERVKAMP